MRHRGLAVGVLLVTLVLGLAERAHAAPILITSGFINIYGDWTAAFSLSGTGFNVGSVFGGGATKPSPTLTAGTVADLAFNVDAFTSNGIATIGGRFLQDPAHHEGLIRLSADLHFDVDPFTVDDRYPNDLYASFSSRFTMNGTIRGRTSTGNELFMTEVIGSGTVNFQDMVRLQDGDAVRFITINRGTGFSFDGAAVPAPVPEPASILLLGTGLVGAGVRRWRQKRA